MRKSYHNKYNISPYHTKRYLTYIYTGTGTGTGTGSGTGTGRGCDVNSVAALRSDSAS